MTISEEETERPFSSPSFGVTTTKILSPSSKCSDSKFSKKETETPLTYQSYKNVMGSASASTHSIEISMLSCVPYDSFT